MQVHIPEPEYFPVYLRNLCCVLASMRSCGSSAKNNTCTSTLHRADASRTDDPTTQLPNMPRRQMAAHSIMGRHIAPQHIPVHERVDPQAPRPWDRASSCDDPAGRIRTAESAYNRQTHKSPSVATSFSRSSLLYITFNVLTATPAIPSARQPSNT